MKTRVYVTDKQLEEARLAFPEMKDLRNTPFVAWLIRKALNKETEK